MPKTIIVRLHSMHTHSAYYVAYC